FVTAYTAVALAPDGGMSYLLPRMIGMARAKEMMMTNRHLTALEALDWGLVNRVIPDNELMAQAEAIAQSLAVGPTLSLGSVKKLVHESFSETLESQMEREARNIVDMTRTDDAMEGINAFLEKRRPVFHGR
ncbi:MAG: enoyl-CoA hydratase, partial [Deltaproteobacteria bacterium]|nr:enoyl-CoA hydratase [Deltaproteobacteria bacterium]